MTKKLLFALLFATRITQLVAWFNRGKVTILCYHSVTKQHESERNDPHKLHLGVDTFIRHLDYLQAHYQIVSLGEFVRARREDIKLPANAAVLTFDDGVRNFLTVVAPLLVKKGMPATAFVMTGERFTQEGANRNGLNGSWRPEDDNSYLTWSEVRELAKQGMEFGSHTCTHRSLTDIPHAQARGELEESLNTLSSYLGSNSFPLSYPHGKSSQAISRLSESLGYSCAVTALLGQNGEECDLFALRRTIVASDDDLPTFVARVSGLTSLYNRIAGLFTVVPAEDLDPSPIGYDPIAAEE
ncbi:MAG TPA: polysaccharide deacetylase family protein [Pyrinomonadaceae bacterium]|jgi:peptidoglycan/xylan/chitin deacetylase (PgdA/CDA1 family)|nr:polysaccharide deacetylase family protein [Pyrinomonadaceae bacterium]